MRLGSAENGMFSLLMVVVVIAMMVLSVIVVELASFGGFRDWMQGILDDAAHQAIVRSLAPDQIRADLGSQLLRTGPAIDVSDVRVTVESGSAHIVVSGRFAGVLLPLLSNIVGHTEIGIPFSVRTRARSQRGRVLVILDRQVTALSDPCRNEGLIAMATFADRLVSGFEQSGVVSSVVGAVPGDREVLDVVTRDGSDGLPRCSPKRSESEFELLGVAGSPHVFDTWNAASAVADAALRELFSESAESLIVVVLMRREAQATGFATRVREFLEQVSQSMQRGLEVNLLVLEGGSAPVRQGGSYGGRYREFGVSQYELHGASLVGVIVRNVRNRVALEF
jgi:hypothetical protein